MNVKNVIAGTTSMAFLLSFAVASAATLTTSCSGVPTSSNIAWTATSTGGIAPIAYLWSNGSTATSQTINELPGTYSMTLQATDASSSAATATCSAVVAAQPIPTISSFAASPASITAGQSTVLAWTTGNASTTSLDNNIGVVSGTSITVSPAITTTYKLSVVNPSGTTTANTTVTVTPVTTPVVTTTVAQMEAQIQTLLSQITSWQSQVTQLRLQQKQLQTPTGPAATSTVTVACSTFSRNLGVGSRGDDVKALQLTLSNATGVLAQGDITGFFGPKTMQALKHFQEKFGIASTSGSAATGYFGPLTRQYISKECKTAGTQSVTVSVSSSATSERNGNNGKDNGKGNSNR